MQELMVTRIKRQMLIHTVVQVFLIALLLFVAWNFQQVFVAKGMKEIFYNSIFATLILQALLFYPIYRFAVFEARLEVQAQATDSAEVQKSLRRKRLAGDLLKAAAFIFYATFIVKAPPATFVLSTTFFSFVATSVTYLQSFNFAAKRLLAGENPEPTLKKFRA